MLHWPTSANTLCQRALCVSFSLSRPHSLSLLTHSNYVTYFTVASQRCFFWLLFSPSFRIWLEASRPIQENLKSAKLDAYRNIFIGCLFISLFHSTMQQRQSILHEPPLIPPPSQRFQVHNKSKICRYRDSYVPSICALHVNIQPNWTEPYGQRWLPPMEMPVASVSR